MTNSEQYKKKVLEALDSALKQLYKVYFKSYDKDIKNTIDKYENYKLKCLDTYNKIVERN